MIDFIKNGIPFIVFAVILFSFESRAQNNKPVQGERVKVIYASDLYFPPDDPDDWFDLATLFASVEIDVLGITLDQQLFDKRPQSEGTGVVPLRQMFEISGHTSPYAVGLRFALRSKDDKGLDQPAVCQKGVEMILDLLRKADGKVVLLTVGTARDFAAAYNRDPELFRKKVSRFYINAGIYGFPPGRMDVNLEKDRNAFIAITTSGLPVYWAPSFGESNYETYWQVNQGEVLESASNRLQNYFLYAFSKGTGEIGPAAGTIIADPIGFLNRLPDKDALSKVYGMSRNMWSTASILDAAGLRIYRNKQGEYAASRRPVGDFKLEVKPYSFKRMRMFVDDRGRVQPGKPGNCEVFVFRKMDVDEYGKSLASILRTMFCRW